MGSGSCWYQNLDLRLLFSRHKSVSMTSSTVNRADESTPVSGVASPNKSPASAAGVRRIRSKSTSSDVSFDAPCFRSRGNASLNFLSLNNNCNSSCEDFIEESCSSGFTDDSFNSAIYNSNRIFNRFGNSVARRELLKRNEINLQPGPTLNFSCGSSRSKHKKGKARFFEIMNAVLLTSVFLLGAFSAVFLTICYVNNNGSGTGGGGRKALFQHLPEVEQLQVIDENYLREEDMRTEIQEEDNECDGDNKLGLELEAVSSVHAAMEMKEQGKIAKAQKLFQHAMALCPRHADVLTNYGEFFEDTRQDYLMADHLYVQALSYAPRHTKALINRKRTLPVVEELDEKRIKRIDAKREQLLQLSETNRSLRRIRKEAYFQQIYHSAGIEGNTMTLAQTRMIVETRMAVGGKSIIEHNEILGLDDALRFINSSLVNRIGKITLKDILLIHKHLMGYVDLGEAGKFRRTQVFVGNHVPPPPEEINSQMAQLVEWLNSEEALSLHPIHYAAIAHYKLVYIHPFLDGNGRTSRLLMNWVLMQANYPPVIIRKQDRHLYYEHLNTANKGDIRPFIRFIGDCTEKTMDVYLWATQEHYPILELEDEAGIKEKDNSDSQEDL